MLVETSWHPFLRAALRGEFVQSPLRSSAELPSLLKVAADHGVDALLFYSLEKSGSLKNFPPELCVQLERQFQRLSGYELMLQSELQKLLSEFEANGIVPLFFKGTALAYQIYPHPALRGRGDTDLLFQEEDQERLVKVLTKASYTRFNSVQGTWISRQDLYSGRNEHGVKFSLDCHFKISSRPQFAEMFPYRELGDRADTIRALDPNARGLSMIDALLIACVHRAVHHLETNRLIWLYDIHLLAGRLAREDFVEFCRAADLKRIRAICRAGLIAAQEHFATNLPEDLMEQHFGVGNVPETSAALLNPPRRPVSAISSELKGLSFRHKAQLLKEHLFPPAEYMLRKYSIERRILLPFFYFYRAIRGGFKSFGKFQ